MHRSVQSHLTCTGTHVEAYTYRVSLSCISYRLDTAISQLMLKLNYSRASREVSGYKLYLVEGYLTHTAM